VQIEELFHRTAECDPLDRAPLLDEACDGDADLRREVEALLASEDKARDDMQAAVQSGLEAANFPLVGETISHYRILEGLDGGGMGLIYRAEDIRLGRQVALKFLPEESTKDPVALGRFEREARSASALEHPNICPIYEFGEHEGQPFLVMPLLEGRTLRALLSASDPAKPPLELSKFLDLALQIAEGLNAAHRHHIIHRDIKPANIFITNQGQAKILDFGLAKLTRAEALEKALELTPNEFAPRKRQASWKAIAATPDPLLSRTGMAMGTAGYMSPEQARGEKLDARTDLFSFGLVLYEMATGRRAFQGNTGPMLHQAILNQTPAPVRRLNPKLPGSLEAIIGKALEKDRSKRYQSAGEMRADLEALGHALERKSLGQRWALASLAGIGLSLVGGLVWFAKSRTPSTQSLPEIKFRQLTINSTENPVSNSAISPDGKYLAYVDTMGIHLKEIETGANQSVLEPSEVKKDSVNWEIVDVGWFPDNTTFLANAHPAAESSTDWSSHTTDIWAFSRTNQTPRKLREHAIGLSVSPDGSLISFATNHGKLGERETWLMKPDGGQARKLFSADENSSLGDLLWSPDSQRVLYVRTNASGDTVWSADLRGGPAIAVLTPSATNTVHGDYSWLPDGRLIFQVGATNLEFTSPQDSCDFWTMRVDVHTGKVVEKPKRLTNWTEFCIANANVSADGKRLAFLRGMNLATIYLADADAEGARLRNVRRFTLDESMNAVQDWTNDSNSIVFTSNRTGQVAVYLQALDEDQPQLISMAAVGDAPVTPDGKWVFGLTWPTDLRNPDRLMRIPLAGGAPQLVIEVAPGVIASRPLEVSCARPPSNLCVLAERSKDLKSATVTSIDPLRGRGPVLATFDLDPNMGAWDFDISPDGTRLAWCGNPEGPIHILSLRGRPEQLIPRKFSGVQEFHWAAHGKGLFVPDQTKRGIVLWYVDLQGNARTLWETRGGGTVWARPSPDGRHVAIESWTLSNNVWMMENF
jgi:serine/threonine protein kinase